jgi:hypothetical protein
MNRHCFSLLFSLLFALVTLSGCTGGPETSPDPTATVEPVVVQPTATKPPMATREPSPSPTATLSTATATATPRERTRPTREPTWTPPTRATRGARPSGSSEAGASDAAALVPFTNNLIINPNFADRFAGWVADEQWTIAGTKRDSLRDIGIPDCAKVGPPTYNGLGIPGQTAVLYQDVAANPEQRTLHLRFWMIEVRPRWTAVTVYGADSADGPWSEVWQPHQAERAQHDFELFDYQTTLDKGYPFYRVEFSGAIPDDNSLGFKLTGVEFETLP